MLFLYLFFLVMGFICLIKGADFFVEGSSFLARRLKVPSVIVGLTIVSIGTSAPELAVSVTSSINGVNELALSNVVGSNMFNMLVVIGVCALVKPVVSSRVILRRDFPVSLLSTVSLLFCLVLTRSVKDFGFDLDMNLVVSQVSRGLGGILLLVFVCYIVVLIASVIKNPLKDDEVVTVTIPSCLIKMFIGLFLIVAGGQCTVSSARSLAMMLGMSDFLIGLTVVAIGTSLPELITSVVAVSKGEVELAIGNAVGSNICNLLLILGLSAVINPIDITLGVVLDLLLLSIASSLVFVFCMTKNSVSRLEGFGMLVLYVFSILFAFFR